MRKLKRDVVVSTDDYGNDRVGVYYADTDGFEILFECDPAIAETIIELWNKAAENHK